MSLKIPITKAYLEDAIKSINEHSAIIDKSLESSLENEIVVSMTSELIEA